LAHRRAGRRADWRGDRPVSWQAGKQAGKQANKQAGGQANRQTGRRADRHTGRLTRGADSRSHLRAITMGWGNGLGGLGTGLRIPMQKVIARVENIPR
jgi:hypothetical protein